MYDMGFIGNKFTWKKELVQEQLDRFLCNDVWKRRFGLFRVIHLPRIKSNHCPMFLQFDNQSPNVNDVGFKFLVAWETHPNWGHFVLYNWNDKVGFMEALADF